MPEEQPEKKKRLSLGCLGEILALLGVAAFFGLPQLRPLALKLSERDAGYAIDPSTANWDIILSPWPGLFLLFAALALVALHRMRTTARNNQDDEPSRPRR